MAALRILADRLPSTLSATMWRRLIELHDDPGANEQDLFEQQSQHPLSRFRVDSGGQHLAAGCLLAAAATASTIDEGVAVEERLLPALAKAVTDPQDSGFRAATVMAVNPLRPLPLDLLAAHPAPPVRQAGAACWKSQRTRYPMLPTVFARDPDRGVREIIAAELAQIDGDGNSDYSDVLSRLAVDPSERVRRATSKASAGG